MEIKNTTGSKKKPLSGELRQNAVGGIIIKVYYTKYQCYDSQRRPKFSVKLISVCQINIDNK